MRVPGASIGCRLHRTSGIIPVVPAHNLVFSLSTISRIRGALAARIRRAELRIETWRMLWGRTIKLAASRATRRLFSELQREAVFEAVAIGGGFVSFALMACALLPDH
ncbi:hypothetical protein H8A95_32510 [Bradyrhizobium sp. Pear76]|uniref:hypothetical protein n=1 Tax=Bradyrhizobium oropedii TaxID=1571201 RepID=UPI001E5ADD4E|nr:hypothetical protein [Bradyrhizobium oropedii]MCC8966926.1 hypothetical protein [Bradyrhizobium oropedii]